MWDFHAIERSPMIVVRLTSLRGRGNAGEAPEWNSTAANAPVFHIVERQSRCAPEFAGWKLRTWDPTAKREKIANRSRQAGNRAFPESVETGEVNSAGRKRVLSKYGAADCKFQMAAASGGRFMKIRVSKAWRPFLRVRRFGRSAEIANEEGTSLVELAISLPIMLMLLTGAASFSLAFYFLQQLGNATTSGVQLVAADQGLVTDPCETAAAAVEGGLPHWATNKLSFTLAWTDSTGGTHSQGPTVESSSTAFSCATAGDGSTDTATAIGPNTPVVLTVSYSYTWLPMYKFSGSSALTSTQAALAY
jgi:Flp pilus assembly protein TadG